MKKEILEWLKALGSALAITLMLLLFITPLKVHSISMNPTLVENDWLILLNSKNANQGDIVSFKTNLPFTEEELGSLSFLDRMKAGDYKNLIKRVIAVEGDSLVINEGRVFINNKELEEPYIYGQDTIGSIIIEEIPKGMIFVMGDNRNRSLDSRDESVGLVKTKDIQGKVVLRLLPISKFGRVK